MQIQVATRGEALLGESSVLCSRTAEEPSPERGGA